MPELEAPRLPDRYCLLIDHGNSRIKWVVAVWTDSTNNWNLDLTTFGEGSVEDFELSVTSGHMMPPEEALICSVGSESVRRKIRGVVADHSSAQVSELLSEERTNGIENGYSDFSRLGADRWMAIVGGTAHHGFPLVVMDLGTATTFDAVDGQGKHLGGLIIPGPGTMFESLGNNTALKVKMSDFINTRTRSCGAAQKNTDAAVVSGIVAAQVGALGQFLTWFQSKSGSESPDAPAVLVTGGAAGAILGKSDYPLIHDPLLVFKGMLTSRFGTDS